MESDSYKKKIADPSVIGIDLGTTNTVAAFFKNNLPFVLKDANSHSMIPSVVKIGNPEIVGEDAKPFLISDPKNTIFASKRLMGRKYDDKEFKEYFKALPYKTVKSCRGDVWIKTDFGKFSPSQIGAKILQKVKGIAENILKKPVKRAVVTVPAYFDDTQRQATKEAGRIAGMDIIRVINEPTAAALAYGLDKKALGNIAVYDLGGGTFDISILEVADGVFHVKSTNGNTFLGGEDFDNEFSKFIINFYEQSEGYSRNQLKYNMEKIKRAAEEARKNLSIQQNTDVYIENAHDKGDIELKITRDQLESVVKKIVQKTVEPCERAIKDAEIDKTEIKHVILVGGMTRMPLVRKTVKEIFGIEPMTDVNPDEVVAQGAAIQAGILAGTVENVVLLDVVPLSLGIETLGGIFSTIISRNTTIPYKQTETFSTSEDNQKEVIINVYQGERSLVEKNKYLGTIKLVNLPAMPRGKPKIDVTFEINSDGILKVSAEDTLSGRKQEIVLTPASGLSDSEIEKILLESAQKEKSDKVQLEIANFKNRANEVLQIIKNRAKSQIPESIKVKILEMERLMSQKDFQIEEGYKLLEVLKNFV